MKDSVLIIVRADIYNLFWQKFNNFGNIRYLCKIVLQKQFFDKLCKSPFGK